jgi:hypothetical protein
MTEQQNYPPNPVQQQPTEPEPAHPADQAQLLREQQAQQARRDQPFTEDRTAPVEPVETGASNESPHPVTGEPVNEAETDPTVPAGATTPAPAGSGSDLAPGSDAPTADEPTTLQPVPPGPVVDTETPPQETGVVTAAGTHPRVMVRLRDVLAHVENFLARHPELRVLEADLKSGIATIEQHGNPAVPVSDTADQQAGTVS